MLTGKNVNFDISKTHGFYSALLLFSKNRTIGYLRRNIDLNNVIHGKFPEVYVNPYGSGWPIVLDFLTPIKKPYMNER